MKYLSFIFLCLGTIFLTTIATAGEIKPYIQSQFDQLSQENKPILLVVKAPWCPTCRRQEPIIHQKMKQENFKEVTALIIDFDSEKALLKRLNVSQQSTLLAYRGKIEIARSIGDTNAQSIETLIEKISR